LTDELFTVPAMWADHHVLAVRDALRAMPGVEAVEASALTRQVRVRLAAGADAATLGAALTAAGYAPGEPGAPQAARKDKPAWSSTALRVTATNPVDLTMSGDHRKY